MKSLRYLPALALSLILALGLFACGSSSSSSSGSSSSGSGSTAARFTTDAVSQKIEVKADPTGAFKWDKAEYTATAGDVTFVVSNPSVVTHNFGIEGNGISVHGSDIGANKTGVNHTLKGLKAGEYQIVCTVAGHREGGMVAKLIVK